MLSMFLLKIAAEGLGTISVSALLCSYFFTFLRERTAGLPSSKTTVSSAGYCFTFNTVAVRGDYVAEVGIDMSLWYLNTFADTAYLFFPLTHRGFFEMLYICHGYRRKRIVLDCSSFYSKEELYRLSRETQKGAQTFFEYSPNLYKTITCDTELKLACSMVEGCVASHQSNEDLAGCVASHQSNEDLAEHRRWQVDRCLTHYAI